MTTTDFSSDACSNMWYVLVVIDKRPSSCLLVRRRRSEADNKEVVSKSTGRTGTLTRCTPRLRLGAHTPLAAWPPPRCQKAESRLIVSSSRLRQARLPHFHGVFCGKSRCRRRECMKFDARVEVAEMLTAFKPRDIASSIHRALEVNNIALFSPGHQHFAVAHLSPHQLVALLSSRTAEAEKHLSNGLPVV